MRTGMYAYKQRGLSAKSKFVKINNRIFSLFFLLKKPISLHFGKNLQHQVIKICSYILLIGLSTTLKAETGNWKSQVTGGDIVFTSTEADSPVKDLNSKYVTVVYLKNLGFDKIGENSNEEDIAWLLSKGYRVIELDYANNENAVTPIINKDIIAINDSISGGLFCGYNNCSNYQSYVLFEGYRIARNVPYFVDNPRIYGDYSGQGDSLYMDIIYPANASEKVPVVLSFSYSNSYHANIHQRLFLGYTLAMFNDSFLEGAPASGIAWAIADHPKYCQWGQPSEYKSFEVNPDAAQKVKSAVRTLRVLGEDLGLSGKIGIFGFSRGSDAGSMAVGDRADAITEMAGFNIGISDDVQAAALGPGVFDFTQIYNYIDDGDKNLENLCPDMWGSLEDNYQLWNSMGAAYFVTSSASAPVLFFYNTDDSPYYLDQIKHFKLKLDTLGVPTDSLINHGTGHSVPQTSESLARLYSFFNQYLATVEDTTTNTDTTQTDTTSVNLIINHNQNNLPIEVFPNPVTDQLKIKMILPGAGKVQFAVYNLSGNLIYKNEEYYYQAGQINKSLPVKELAIPTGTYFVKITTERDQGITKFVTK